MLRPICALFLISAVLAPGCSDSSGGRVAVKGRVLYRALPVSGKTLTLAYVADQPSDSFSQLLPLNPQGEFSGEVPKAGKYKVTISESFAVMDGFEKPPAKAPKLPEKYKLDLTTDITLEIGTSGFTGDIELKD